MNEHSFIRSVHRLLPKDVYRWKINDNFAGGVPDAYYSGPKGDVWIEYKYVKLPKKDHSEVRFGASAQQILWLCERKKEGRNVLLVVGSDEGVVVFDSSQEIAANSCSRQHFISNTIDRKSLVQLLYTYTHQAIIA